MNSRDRRDGLDPFEVRIRESLLLRAGRQAPASDTRRRLLQRAHEQRRRLGWRRPMWSVLTLGFPGLFDPGYHNRMAFATAQQHQLYAEALFGPRLGWASFSQLLR
jgi:hypothetical protein